MQQCYFGFFTWFFADNYTNLKVAKYFSEQQTKLGKINGHIEEIYSGHMVIKAYNAQNECEEEFVNLNSNLYTSAWKAQFISGLMMPIMSFVSNFAYVAVCIVGAVLAMNGVISFGVIVAFMLYVRLFTQPLSTLAQAANVMQSALAAKGAVALTDPTNYVFMQFSLFCRR